MKNTYITHLAVTLTIIVLLSNCKKKKDTTSTENPTPSTSPTCFNSLYIGTYIGSGFLMSSPYTSGTLTITKTNCQSVNLNLYVNSGGGTSTQASQLVINSANAYEGKQSNGNNITITPGGNNIQINAIGSFTFNGNK